jgi:pSer/pThr/pTyr-binding forkhead associated (FHA) protein
MSELTLLVLRIGFLAALWVFVFFVVYSIRADLFGQRVRKLPDSTAVERGREAEPFIPAASGGSTGVVAAAHLDLDLVLTSGAMEGNSLGLSGEPVAIGRSPDSTLVIRDDYTSTNHARISVENGNWVLTDLGSTNGTLCGGVPVSGTVTLHINESVTIGATTFELRRRP